jgi:hypothetical protein
MQQDTILILSRHILLFILWDKNKKNKPKKLNIYISQEKKQKE